MVKVLRRLRNIMRWGRRKKMGLNYRKPPWKWDGSDIKGCKGRRSLSARIVTVADVFDARPNAL